MRNQLLTGYLLHHKPYQENRALYYFFTPTHGLVHGVGKKGMPLFTHIQLFATGKRSLKSFSQIQPAIQDSNYNQHNLSPLTDRICHSNKIPILSIQARQGLTGQNLYAGFYLNEVLWKLLESEDPLPKLWQYYQFTLDTLRTEINNTALKLLLRHFEKTLFDSLGYGFNLLDDTQGQHVKDDFFYRFVPDEGFIHLKPSFKEENTFSTTSIFSGRNLLNIFNYLQSSPQNTHIDGHSLQAWSRLHKQMIDYLVDYQPLKSRELWQQFMKYR